MPESKIPITVVVPVKNEEANLGKCLSRLSRFSEVIVVDSSSTDRTPVIANEHGANIVNFSWDGKYPKKRNWLLLNVTLRNKWVLFLDADEFVNAAFCDAVDRATQDPNQCGFWLNYDNFFLGRRLRYGVPQRKLALFRVGKALYEQIEEDHWSTLDMEVHEHPLVDGPVGEIAARIEHNDDRGIIKFVDRHRDYAVWEAHRIMRLRSSGVTLDKMTRRQRLKYGNFSKWWYPWAYFLFTYFFKFGFLDGSAGFQYAFYKTWYFQTIRLLISEKKERK
ncbi:MAG: glycosyltransferase family 2 protein [Mesorhizobium sp.]|uniref:glycosyltransferase family 2 protein n=1 Tax=Mesorhizobium sp. TaxID=1871066 RepID=UPI00121CFC45|nr:glycosyltransferase family 2 protein [Mesorhizobium sp.]TIP74934.1 MAG: glycosyltransferase family 2 protein [Mesorhizobium sp.]TIQ12527.1 MAG: glycosyltransferase family 2 protein [Mesorhizobium sp.]TIR51735.1 MAG: glycosyltransferase family 2 protein [Mesorhizobium sp.]TJV96354.1 MAG: glycosyltransferase family 2 protein [Mesorhizobium sp.]